MDNKAPIIIFCYRRKINKLINSLLKNKDTIKSDLFIFSDGFKSVKDKNDVISLRKSLNQISGFKNITIFNSNKNNGLANSIIKGLKYVLNIYDKAIILEDDLIVSPNFIEFMNDALSFYKDNKKIWSISGYSPPLNCFKSLKGEVYLSVRPYSWGWATWSDRLNKADWSNKSFLKLEGNKKKIKEFELGGNDLYRMFELQYLGKIDSWAIQWCYSQFVNSSYSVIPKKSLTQNIGFYDNLGTHNKSGGLRWKVNLAQTKISPHNISPDTEFLTCFKKYHDLTIFSKFKYFLKKWFVKKIK